jgi:hypothetical protein
MLEKQNIEYKSNWHDDYLKWACGFANAQGGRIYIGKDDAGAVVGVEDSKRLMDEIPNKIKKLMGITAEVNLFGGSRQTFYRNYRTALFCTAYSGDIRSPFPVISVHFSFIFSLADVKRILFS